MWISRREFLRSAGAVMLIGGSVPFLNGCTGFKRVDVKQKNVAVTDLKQDEIHILELAALAPSGRMTST